MRQAWNLPLQRDVGVFIILVVLSVAVIVVDRLGEDGAITGQLARVFVPFQTVSSKLMDFSFVQKETPSGLCMQ